MLDKRNWSWIKEFMPNVVALLAEYRAGEGAHLDECWQRGVLRGEPGWFFAQEGAVCLGTPFDLAAAEAAVRAQGFALLLAPLPDGSQCRRLNAREREAQAIVEWKQREAEQLAKANLARWGVVVAQLEGVSHGAH